jgi:hypothetical protein
MVMDAPLFGMRIQIEQPLHAVAFRANTTLHLRQSGHARGIFILLIDAEFGEQSQYVRHCLAIIRSVGSIDAHKAMNRPSAAGENCRNRQEQFRVQTQLQFGWELVRFDERVPKTRHVRVGYSMAIDGINTKPASAAAFWRMLVSY